MNDIGLIAALAKAIGGSGSSPSGGGGGLVVRETESSGVYTLDKTWKEIHDAMVAGTYVVIIQVDDTATIVSDCFFYIDDDVYVVMPGSNRRVYGSQTQTGYPSYTQGPQ